MFSSFSEAFSSSPKFIAEIPEAVLNSLTKKLPDGFKYIAGKDGICRIDSTDGAFSLEKVSYAFPEGFTELYGERPTVSLDDVIAYANNSQQPVVILTDEDGCYTVNGEKINANDFVIAPMKNIEITGGHLCILPEKFPDPFPIEVSGNGYSMALMVQRQKNRSISIYKFSSVDQKPLSINYYLDPKDKESHMKIDITLSQTGSASDILASKEIFNAFLSGTGTMCGAKLNISSGGEEKLIPEEVIIFWHKLVDVERYLCTSFDMSQELSIEDIRTIKQLYCSFIQNKPFRHGLNDLTLSGIGRFNRDNMKIDQEIMFKYIEGVEIDILGKKIQCYTLSAVFGGKVSILETAPTNTEGEFKIKLEPADGKEMFSSTQYFIDNDALEKTSNSDNFAALFFDSDKLS